MVEQCEFRAFEGAKRLELDLPRIKQTLEDHQPEVSSMLYYSSDSRTLLILHRQTSLGRLT